MKQARDPYREAIGERITTLMRRRSLTAQVVSDHMRVDEATVRRWKKGKSMPTLDQAGRLCSLLRCSAEWLIGDPDSRDPQGGTVFLIHTQTEALLLGSDTIDREYDERSVRVSTTADSTLERVAEKEYFVRLNRLVRHRKLLRDERGWDDGDTEGMRR